MPISLGPVPANALTWFDKFLYGRLRYEARNSDRCSVALSALAKELAISEDSVARSVDRLSKAGLICRRRSRYAVLIIFLRSPLLNGSIPKSGHSEPAAVRTLDTNPEPAAVRTLEGITEGVEPAAMRNENPQPCGLSEIQNPQPCGPEPAAVRVAYKEDLGVLGITTGAKNAPEKNTSRSDGKRSAGDPTVTEWFDSEFWRLYPRHEDKADAIKAAIKHGRTAHDRSAIIAKLRADLPELTTRERNFIPLPASWLNKRRWMDGPAELPTTHANGAPPAATQTLSRYVPR